MDQGDNDSVSGSGDVDTVSSHGHQHLLPGSIVLAESSYRAALARGDSAAAAALGAELTEAITEQIARDRARLTMLGHAGGGAERAFLNHRVELLERQLHGALRNVEPAASIPCDSGTLDAHPQLPETREEVRHRADIQGLRAVAVLLVVLCHAGVGWLAGGYVGVDVFFVLSGFLITGLLLAEARWRRFVSLADFYLRRARRILPAATLVLLATDFAAYHLLNVVRAKQALQDSVPSALFGANIHFALAGTDYFARGQPPSPVQHFWSLAVEEQFYLFWPLLLILVLGLSLRRYAPRPAEVGSRATTRLLVVLATAITASFVWSVLATARQPASAYFSTLTRAWELGLGAAIVIAFSRLTITRGLRMVLGWAGLLCIVVAACVYSVSTPFPGLAAILPTVGAGMIIVAGIAGAERRGSVGWILSSASLRYIGDRSYGFYLWHWPVLVIAADRAGHRLSVGTNLLLMAGAFVLADVTYRLYERPIRFAQWARQPPAVLPLASSTIAVIVLATAFVSSIDNREDAQRLQTETYTHPELKFAVSTVLSASGPASSSTEVSELLPAVGAEVAAEARGRRMPAALDPAVSDLLNDHVNLPAQCTAHEGQTTHAICRMGAASSRRTLVILGDSHAEMWMPAILNLAQRERLAVVPVMKSGCSPPDWMGSLGSNECRTWFRWALGQVSVLRPQTTVIAGYYSFLGPNDTRLLTNGLDAAIGVLHKSSRQIVIIGDPPERHQQPVDCLLKPGATPQGCAETLGQTYRALTNIVSDVAAYYRTGFVDTSGWFCTQDRCPLVIGNLIAYRDTNHVSQTYANALSSAFRAAFDLATKPSRTHRYQ